MDTSSSSGTTTGTNGTTGGPTGGPPADWTRVAALADELDRSPRWLREWVATNVPDALQQRLRRRSGGAPELWVGPDAVAQLRGHFGNGTTSGGTTGGPAGPPEAPAGPPAEPDAGWRAAVDAAVARAHVAEGEADRLRHELETLRATVDRANFRAEEADRGRYEAEARLEAVRTAAWSWVATVRGLAWWRRLRRLPDPPPALVAGERLLAKPAD